MQPPFFFREMVAMSRPKYPNVLCLLTGGPTYEIEADGKRWFFEWNWYAGPTVLNRNTHAPIVTQPGEKSPFWDAVVWWSRQGRRMKDGLCVWNREREAVYGKTYAGRSSCVIGSLIRGECCEIAKR